MMKFTPGPWRYDEHGGNFHVWGGPYQAEMVADNQDEDGFVPSDVVTRMRGTGRGASDEEKKANAALISAAPELLEACKDLLAAHSPAYARANVERVELPKAVQAALAAIAKAEDVQ